MAHHIAISQYDTMISIAVMRLFGIEHQIVITGGAIFINVAVSTLIWYLA